MQFLKKIKNTKKIKKIILSSNKIYQNILIGIAAAIIGLIAVLYAQLTTFIQNFYIHSFNEHTYLVCLLSPGFFLIASFLVCKFAPQAKGSGIPQVIQAIEIAKKTESEKIWSIDLISLKTVFVKILSSLVGLFGGASVGREGPTVQVAASGFAYLGKKIHRFFPEINFQICLIAGAASGVAAAFNTPLAGITFAIEELADGLFEHFRHIVLLTIIIAGIVAQALIGNYLYFGHPTIAKPTFIIFPEAILIGSLLGIFGGIFAKLLSDPSLTYLPKNWIIRSLICGSICSFFCLITHADTAGSGYEITKKVLESYQLEDINVFFPFFKICTTVFSYLSGIAGGIFSPCLSIGAAFGLSFAKIFHFENFHICALIGMVAFFSAVIQSPLTAVIIVMEMTDEHILVIPFMIAAFLAQSIAKIIMPIPLYKFLAENNKLSFNTTTK